MSDQSVISVKIDDRIRLMSVVLSATDYPMQAQARKKHHPHAHARGCAKMLHDKDMTKHPAVVALQALLDDNVSLKEIYTLIMMCDWPQLTIEQLPKWVPPRWNEHLWDFYKEANLEQYWKDSQSDWDNAVEQLTNVGKNVRFKEFLAQFVGEIEEDFIFMPNICYPANEEIGVRTNNNQLITIVPPPLAWGDSPPWPFDEETMLTHSYRAGLTEYGRLLLETYLKQYADKVAEASQKSMPVDDKFKDLHKTWEDQFTSLFVTGAVAIYLEDYVHKAEAKAYILMEKKARGMTIVPGVVSVLRRYLQERGKKFENLADFLTVFPSQLRVAKRIVL